MRTTPNWGTLADRCRRAFKEPPSIARQLGALLLLLFFALLVLVALNWVERREIWGELVFALIILWLGLVALTQLSDERLEKRLRVPPLPGWQAAIWAVVTVLALPIAIVYWPWGFLLFAAPALVVYGLVRRMILVPLWLAALLGLGMLLVGVVISSKLATPNDMSPAAATPAVADSEELAWRFRPLLFFDDDEEFIPLDIEDAASTGNLIGWKQALLGPESDDVDETTDFRDFSYVEVDDEPLRRGQAAGGADSAYYFHAVEPSPGGRVYLDYWWFHAQNPSPFGGDLFCGSALRWLWLACAEHPADWEGITVVLERCSATKTTSSSGCVVTPSKPVRVVEVHYAQHDKVLSYSWEELEGWWEEDALGHWWSQSLGRPLVFVALKSHASYPRPCNVKCKQEVRSYLRERRNGGKEWTNNGSSCRDECLKPLPVTAEGAPDSWNAFSGPWGTQKCLFNGIFCDVHPAPRAPSFQTRYRNPAAAHPRP
jgi:hypothetical protein